MEAPLVGRDRQLAELVKLLDSGGCVVLAGPTGVGKTRLIREAAAVAVRRGIRVERITGSHTARALAFGASAHLVPVGGDDAHAAIVGAVSGLERIAEQEGLLLIVDDAHLLDAGSATLVHQLVLAGVGAVVATVRTTDTPPSDAIDALWVDGDATRRELAPLRRAETVTLVSRTLDGEVGDTLADEVWRLSGGNPLFVRELLSAGRESGAFVRDDDEVWRVGQPLSPSTRLRALVGSRLGRVPTSLQDALEILAVGEPLRWSVVRRLVDAATLEELERRGLARTDVVGGLPVLHTTHPLYGEVLRAAMPLARRADLAERIAQGVDESEDPSPRDRLLAARLLLDADRKVPAALAVDAARVALGRFDAPLAERLARHAGAGTVPDDAASFTAELVLGQALQLQGRGEQADAALARAERGAPGDAEHAQATLARARNCRWNLGDAARADRRLRAALSQLSSSGSKAMLEAELAFYHAITEDFGAARRLARDALGRSEVPPRVELSLLVVLTLTDAMLGIQGEMDHHVRRGFELAERFRAEEPLAADQLGIAELCAWQYSDPRKALAIAQASQDPRSPMLGVWRYAEAMTHMLRGGVDDALVTVREGIAALEHADPFRNLPMARSIQGLAAAYAGDAARVHAALSVIDDAALAQPRTRVWYERAHAWEEAHAGRWDDAAARVAAAGRAAIEHSHVLWGADALHDAVRFGFPDLVAAELRRSTEHTDVALVGRFAEHAEALAARDVDGLTRTARAFADDGYLLYATEAFVQAGISAGSRRALEPLLQARVLAARCPGARGPLLAGVADVVSGRELEVVCLAVAGIANRDIATRLYLSHRTVENHLARVYRRVGLDGRGALKDLLGGFLDGSLDGSPSPSSTTQPGVRPHSRRR